MTYSIEFIFYNTCASCNEKYISSRKKYNSYDKDDYLCDKCKDEYNSKPSLENDLSVISFNHMQSVINDLKQQVYKLKVENYLLKKQIK